MNATRSADEAIAGSWVTMTTVVPSSPIARSAPSTTRELPESSAPVGSSAKRILGALRSARMTAQRCASPPEAASALVPRLPAREKREKRRPTRTGSALRPASSSGRTAFSSRVR